MIFSGKSKAADTAEPKKRSLVSSLLVPDVGDSVHPLQETTFIFVKLIAMIFAMNGLFPKDHLDFSDTIGNKLRLSHVLSIAWRHLSFTREGAPKVVLFFAVSGTLVFSALMIITIFILMFIGKAHAQTTFFTAPDQPNDIAFAWLEFLFKGTQSAVFANTSYLGQVQPVQTALLAALAFYSNAILVFAAFILFYHLVSMIVETAHHGTPMGKRANQIWAPIRLVVAVGLLVPVSSQGLNCGQFIAVQLAEWGSGLASQVWSTFVTTMVTNTNNVTVPNPYIDGLAEKIVLIGACVAFQNYDWALDNSAQGNNDPSTEIIARPITKLPSGDIGYEYRTATSTGSASCGQYIIHKAKFSAGSASTLADAVATAQDTAFKAAYDVAYQAVTNFVSNDPPYFFGDKPPADPDFTASNDIYQMVINAYNQSLDASLSAAVTANTAAANTSSWTSAGWISAGAFFNKIANSQGDIETAIQSSIPSVTGPVIGDVNGAGSLGTMWPRVFAATGKYAAWLKSQSKLLATLPISTAPAPASGSACDSSVMDYARQTLHSAVGELMDSSGKIDVPAATEKFIRKAGGFANDILGQPLREAVKSNSIIDELARVADSAATMNCVWSPADPKTDQAQLASDGSSSFLGIIFTGSNPYTSLVRLGHGNLNTAYFLINVILASSLTVFTSFITGIVTFIATIFFACGFTLAYFLPLVPFMTFLMNSVTWIIMVLEAVIMMPLVALAHLNPEGDGLPGQNARNAYFFLFGIMLRPVLMIFGLICAWLVSVTGLALMNKLYMIAVSGAMDIGGNAHILISRLIFSLMYVVIVYIICHKSFHLISSIPNHAMAWIGAQAAPHESMGSAAENLGGTFSAVSTYGGQQLFSNVGEAGKSAGAAVAKLPGGNVATVAALGSIGLLAGMGYSNLKKDKDGNAIRDAKGQYQFKNYPDQSGMIVPGSNPSDPGRV